MTENEAIKLHISENIHRIEVIEDFLMTNSDANDKECRKNIDILTKINKVLEEVQRYRAIGTPEECLRNKDFLDFLADKMNPNDFETYLRIYNSQDKKGGGVNGD